MKLFARSGTRMWPGRRADKAGLAFVNDRAEKVSTMFDTRTNRGNRPANQEAIDAFVALARGDPDKALVVTHIGQFVINGLASWEMLDTGEVEVRFTSGETYLLAKTTILRLA
jgi:hypothetical protein